MHGGADDLLTALATGLQASALIARLCCMATIAGMYIPLRRNTEPTRELPDALGQLVTTVHGDKVLRLLRSTLCDE